MLLQPANRAVAGGFATQQKAAASDSGEDWRDVAFA